MAIKIFKPKTAALRFTKLVSKKHLSRDRGPSSLLTVKAKVDGRNNQGKITVRHKGGAHKRKNRIIDFKRDKYDVPGVVTSFHYDPNRSANIALITYADGDKRFILAPKDIAIGAKVIAGEQVDAVVGNAMKVGNVPQGTEVHAVENKPGRGAVFARSAGQYAIVQGKDSTGKFVQLKLLSGEIRLVPVDAMCTIGHVGNDDWMNRTLGKAGRARNLGIRPSVRGMVMHPAQHAHGGGEGKGVIGGPSTDIYGNRRGTKTRKNKRTDKFIVKRRK